LITQKSNPKSIWRKNVTQLASAIEKKYKISNAIETDHEDFGGGLLTVH